MQNQLNKVPFSGRAQRPHREMSSHELTTSTTQIIRAKIEKGLKVIDGDFAFLRQHPEEWTRIQNSFSQGDSSHLEPVLRKITLGIERQAQDE